MLTGIVTRVTAVVMAMVGVAVTGVTAAVTTTAVVVMGKGTGVVVTGI